MEITHNWKIRKLIQKNDGSGLVIQVYFKVHSTDETYSYVSGGNVELSVENITNFVSYENLTEELVMEWIKDVMGPSLGGYEQINMDWINSMKNPMGPPTKIDRLPWEPVLTPVLELTP